MNERLKRWIIISMLTSICVVVSYLESFIPMFIPGVKLGLANVIILIMLYEFKWYEALFTDVVRILIVALIRGTLLTPVFMMSLTGGVLSYLVMLIFTRGKWFSVIGTSVLGSISHCLGQLLMAGLLIDELHILYYLPFMGILSVMTGVLSALICRTYLSRSITKRFLEGERAGL